MRLSKEMNNSRDKRMEEIVRLMERDDSVDAPVDSIRWAKNIYRTRAAEKPSFVQRLVASLQVDLASGKPAFGERSGSAAAARQMLFNAGENAVDLRVTAEDSLINIHGQVLGEGFSGGKAVLTSGEEENETPVSDTGEFRFDQVPKAFYTLTLTSSVREIVIQDVEL